MNIEKAVKAAWSVTVFAMMLISSIPFSLADMELTRCDDMEPSSIMYSAKPLEMAKTTKDIVCCGDGTNFQYQYGKTCSGTYSKYEMTYCKESYDQYQSPEDSCSLKCESEGYDDSRIDYMYNYCECSRDLDNPDYQYFFYVDKKSVDNIEIEIKQVSGMKKVIFIENLVPETRVELSSDGETLTIYDSTSFIVHGDGEYLDMGKGSDFKEELSIVPTEDADTLVASMLSSTMLLSEEMNKESVTEAYDMLTTILAIGMLKSLIKTESGTGVIEESTDGILLYEASFDENSPEKGVFRDIELEEVGKSSSVNGAKDLMLSRNLNNENSWKNGLESKYYIIMNDGKAKAMVDLTKICSRSKKGVGLNEVYEYTVKKKIDEIYPDALIVNGHSHPNGILTPSRGDYISTGTRFQEETSTSISPGFEEFYNELSPNGVETLRKDVIDSNMISILDPDGGDMRIFFLDTEELMNELNLFREYEKVLRKSAVKSYKEEQGIRGDVNFDDLPQHWKLSEYFKPIQRYKKGSSRKQIVDFELFLGKNPNSDEISNVIKLIDTKRDMVYVKKNLEVSRHLFHKLKTMIEKDSFDQNEFEKIKYGYEMLLWTTGLFESSGVESGEKDFGIRQTRVYLDETKNAIAYLQIQNNEEFKFAAQSDELEINMRKFMQTYVSESSSLLRDASELMGLLKERGMLDDSSIELISDDVKLTDDIFKEQAQSMIKYMDQDYIVKSNNALFSADNSKFTSLSDNFVTVDYFDIGDVLITSGIISRTYASYIDNTMVMKISNLAIGAGMLINLSAMGISISAMIFTLTAAITEGTLLATVASVGVMFISGTIVAVILGILVSAIITFIICIKDPGAPFCGCSVNPNYEKPVIEMETTMIRPGESINYVVYGMQFCEPKEMFGVESSMYNLFLEKEGLSSSIIGNNIEQCYFDNGMCCEGTVSFDMFDFGLEEGEHEIYGGVTWGPQSGFVAVTDPVTVTVLNDFTKRPIDIHSGWNMISTPYTNVNFKVNDCKLANRAWHYNGMDYDTTRISQAVDKIEEGKVSHPIKMDNVEGGVGYWVYSYNECEITYSLTSDSQPVEMAELGEGWNQIAVPPEGLSKLNVECDLIEDPKTWDVENQEWEFVDEMVVGKSYLVNCYPEKV